MKTSTALWSCLLALLFSFPPVLAVGQTPTTNRMTIRWPAGAREPWLSVQARKDGVTVIERTAHFQGWLELLRGHGPLAEVPDLSATGQSQRFYRTSVRDKTILDDWK